MFIDLAPVLLKTFSPGTVYDVLQRNAAVRLVRNSRADAAADSDHESRKQAITRDFDLKSHQAVTEAGYHQRILALYPGLGTDAAAAFAGGAAGTAASPTGERRDRERRGRERGRRERGGRERGRRAGRPAPGNRPPRPAGAW